MAKTPIEPRDIPRDMPAPTQMAQEASDKLLSSSNESSSSSQNPLATLSTDLGEALEETSPGYVSESPIVRRYSAEVSAHTKKQLAKFLREVELKHKLDGGKTQAKPSP